MTDDIAHLSRAQRHGLHRELVPRLLVDDCSDDALKPLPENFLIYVVELPDVAVAKIVSPFHASHRMHKFGQKWDRAWGIVWCGVDEGVGGNRCNIGAVMQHCCVLLLLLLLAVVCVREIK